MYRSVKTFEIDYTAVIRCILVFSNGRFNMLTTFSNMSNAKFQLDIT